MNVEQAAAEALLDQGVSVPFKEVRIPFTRLAWKLRLTMRRPYLGGVIRIARHYLKIGVTYEQMLRFTKEQEMAFVAEHGKRVSQMIALTICRGFVSGRIFTPVVAFLIRWGVKERFILEAYRKYITLLGTRPFLHIIRSAEMTNPMTPRLSHDRKGS